MILCIGIKIYTSLHNYGQNSSQSGLVSKHGIYVGAGVVDDGYKGEVAVLLFN